MGGCRSWRRTGSGRREAGELQKNSKMLTEEVTENDIAEVRGDVDGDSGLTIGRKPSVRSWCT